MMTEIYIERISLPKGQLSALIKQRNDVIEQAEEPGLHEIVNLLDAYLFKALLINCGGLLFWLSPFILFVCVRNRFVNVWPDRIRLMIRSFVLVPGRTIIK